VTEEEYHFGAYISDILSSHPEWLGTAIQATQAGVSSALKQSEADRVEWETIAMVATDARLFKSKSIWIGDKLERLKGRASCRWDHIIARLKGETP
jgi:hypothetical protein